jgi:hypothetical protein
LGDMSRVRLVIGLSASFGEPGLASFGESSPVWSIDIFRNSTHQNWYWLRLGKPLYRKSEKSCTSSNTHSHGPPWECRPGRSAAPLRVGPDDAERRRRHSHGGPWERENLTRPCIPFLTLNREDFAYYLDPSCRDRHWLRLVIRPLASFGGNGSTDRGPFHSRRLEGPRLDSRANPGGWGPFRTPVPGAPGSETDPSHPTIHSSLRMKRPCPRTQLACSENGPETPCRTAQTSYFHGVGRPVCGS